jgi:ribosomal-protein-alanine N-acetyltransferase
MLYIIYIFLKQISMIKIKIVKIKKKDLCQKWINYLNDPIVVKFSAQSKKRHTLQSQRKFIVKKLKDKNSIVFKILLKKKFIGTIEIKNIDRINKYAEVSYMIGEKSVWGMGIGTIAIKEIILFAKNKLKISKIGAGIMRNNICSQRVLEKNNFKKFGVIKNYYKTKKEAIDKIFFIKYLT